MKDSRDFVVTEIMTRTCLVPKCFLSNRAQLVSEGDEVTFVPGEVVPGKYFGSLAEFRQMKLKQAADARESEIARKQLETMVAATRPVVVRDELKVKVDESDIGKELEEEKLQTQQRVKRLLKNE
jgi:hypothetical protein